MGNTSSPYSTLILIALMVAAFYFLIIRPNKKRQQAQQQTMNTLKPGTRVLLTSGVFGTILEIGQKQALLELSPGVHLTVLKQAIARIVKEGDEDTAWDSEEDEESLDDVDTSDLDSTDLDPNDPRVDPSQPGGETYPSRPDTYQSSSDQDPRPGTNTTPNKD
jgi:preprotein translocase subunit YajC